MLRVNCHIETWNQFRKGSNTALLELYNQHYVGLLNYGIKITGCRDTASDCITQLLLRLWDTRLKLPAVENVRSYLLTSLRNELLSEIRRENARTMGHHLISKMSEKTEEPYEQYLVRLQENLEIKAKLNAAFGKLTDREKQLLKLKFFEDLDYDEIASTCNITKRTAYNIIHNAVKTLKTEFYPQHAGANVPVPAMLAILLPLLIA